jgi:hypothetical protein
MCPTCAEAEVEKVGGLKVTDPPQDKLAYGRALAEYVHNRAPEEKHRVLPVFTADKPASETESLLPLSHILNP